MSLALLGRSGSSWHDESCPLLRSNRVGFGGASDDLCVCIGGIGEGDDSSVWLKPPRVQDKNHRRRSENWDFGTMNSRTVSSMPHVAWKKPITASRRRAITELGRSRGLDAAILELLY